MIDRQARARFSRTLPGRLPCSKKAELRTHGDFGLGQISWPVERATAFLDGNLNGIDVGHSDQPSSRPLSCTKAVRPFVGLTHIEQDLEISET
jgi:hypothetical protein